MRTSNKILLTSFIAILLMLTSIYGAVYLKYKNNNFITAERVHEERYDSYPLAGVQSVSLTGFDRVTVFPSDTARLEVEKQAGGKPLHVFSNGILTLKGEETVNNNDGTTRVERNYRDILLYLPYHQIIQSSNSSLTVKGSVDSTKNLSVKLIVEATNLQIGSFDDRPGFSLAGHFTEVDISAKKDAAVTIDRNAAIKTMEANLEYARFEDGAASIDSLRLSSDAASTISISGKNIAKTIFIPKP